jgi:hypothetical protein
MRCCIQLAIPDPFTPYEALKPGEWAGIVRERYPCKRQLLAPVTDSEPALQTSAELSSCAISPDSGPIGSVIVVSRQARIREVQFLPTNIQVIELVRRWGRPDRIQRVHQSYVLSWDVGVVARAPAGGQFSYLLPVRSVLLRPGT